MKKWTWIPGWRGKYKISLSTQEIKSVKRKCFNGIAIRIVPEKILKHRSAKGYQYVTLTREGISRNYKIHTLMLLTFSGPCPPGMECRHLDDNKLNNSIENLEWGTHKQNGIDASKNGNLNSVKGENHGRSKLTEKKVLQIRKLYSTGNYTLQEIAYRFLVSQSLIGAVVRNEIWNYTS